MYLNKNLLLDVIYTGSAWCINNFYVRLEKYVFLKCEQSEKTNLCVWYNETFAIKRAYDFGLIDKKWMEN